MDYININIILFYTWVSSGEGDPVRRYPRVSAILFFNKVWDNSGQLVHNVDIIFNTMMNVFVLITGGDATTYLKTHNYHILSIILRYNNVIPIVED